MMMNNCYRTFIGFLVFVFLSTLPNTVLAEKRVALVIGNSNYKISPLKNPANDATDMAATLNNLGFDVSSYTDIDRKGMRQAIRDFGEKLKVADVGLFYFAGHGIQLKGRNYLVPLSTDVTSADEVEDESIDASAILRKMESAGTNVNIVILDACRNNPFASSFRSLDRGLARMDGPVGSFIAYATSPGSVAADGGGRNGLYTKYLLDALKQPGLSIEQTFKRVRNSVKNATQGKQIPWESSSLMGEFAFLPSASPNPPPIVVSPTPQANVPKYLQVIANVPSATVSINKINRGLINDEGVLNISNIAENEIEVMVSAPGYAAVIEKVTLVPGQWQQVNVNLQPIRNNYSCAQGKRAFLNMVVEYYPDNAEAKIMPNNYQLNSMLSGGLNKYGVEFIDSDLLKENHLLQLKKSANTNTLAELSDDYNIQYKLNIFISVRENYITLFKTNMKTISGNIMAELLDLKTAKVLGSTSKSFKKPNLDWNDAVQKIINEEVNNMSKEIITQVCSM